MRLALRGLFWITVFAAVAVAPLLIARLGEPQPGHGWVRDFSAALGFIGLAIMVMQFGLAARWQRVAAPFGMDALLQFHRQIGYVALAFILAHPVLLFVDDPDKLALLDWPNAPNRARFAVSATAALFLLIAMSVLRKRLHLKYEWWQVAHGVLAVAAVVLALLHVVGVDYYASRPVQRGLWIAMSAAVVLVVAWRRVIRPIVHLRRRWQVTAVTEERGGAWTLEMEPDGHPGFSFAPGQFGWITVGGSPFAVSQHPFSFSSSAETDKHVEMTIKARGDFTATIKDVKPGTACYIDGPYGLFSIDQHEGPGFVFIAGGIGITPIMSCLRTMADREDVRPVVLMYGSNNWDSVTFRDQLDALTQSLSLTVVHVLDAPGADWDGETGYINAALMERHLPMRFERMRYFVCGPLPMMDAVENELASLGVPPEHITSERFDMV